MRIWVLLGLGLAAGALAGALAGGPVAARLMPDAGEHGAWYASRAAGVASYLMIWLSVAGGLAMSSAWFDGLVNRARLLAIHQTSGIAGVVLGLAHALVLIPDGWTHFGFADVLIPFGSYYARSLSAVGQLSLYLLAIVSFSFWFRGLIGTKTWRLIHYGSFVAYLGALWHGLKLGTDAHEPWLMATYLGTSLLVVVAFVVRLSYIRPQRRRTAEGARAA
jgi:predicted ferric reductase